MKKIIQVSCATALLLVSWAASAESVTVQAVGVKYDPMIVFIEPADTVSWTGMAAHNVETISELGPEGAEKVVTELGADVTLTFDTVGIQVYKCTPHWGTRMGGIIVVGKPENAQGIVEQYLSKINEEKGDLLPAKGLVKKLPAELEAQGMS